MLGEHAHAQLVEWRGCQCIQSLRFQVIPLMHPGITGGANLDVRRPIIVTKMECVPHPHRAVAPRPRRRDQPLALPPIQLRAIADRPVAQDSGRIRHEANPIHAIAVVETGHILHAVVQLEARPHGDIREWIAPVGPVRVSSTGSYCEICRQLGGHRVLFSLLHELPGSDRKSGRVQAVVSKNLRLSAGHDTLIRDAHDPKPYTAACLH